jgi:hypothetical protein
MGVYDLFQRKLLRSGSEQPKFQLVASVMGRQPIRLKATNTGRRPQTSAENSKSNNGTPVQKQGGNVLWASVAIFFCCTV